MKDYRKLLKQIKEEDIVDAYIAYEMYCSWTIRLDDESFNKLCSLSYQYWLDSECSDIALIVRATLEVLKHKNANEITLDDIATIVWM